eukprot:1195331-Prorocentrum_minimum.AAC.6
MPTTLGNKPLIKFWGFVLAFFTYRQTRFSLSTGTQEWHAFELETRYFAVCSGPIWQTVWTNVSSAPTDASNWRTDEAMTSWYKSVQSRKKNEKVKTYKQAMKDAQWIIDRRARQMKEIRDRQKAEVRAGNPHFDTRKSAK